MATASRVSVQDMYYSFDEKQRVHKGPKANLCILALTRGAAMREAAHRQYYMT